MLEWNLSAMAAVSRSINTKIRNAVIFHSFETLGKKKQIKTDMIDKNLFKVAYVTNIGNHYYFELEELNAEELPKKRNKIFLLILFFCAFAVIASEKPDEKQQIENAMKTVLEREMNYCNYFYDIETFDRFASGITRKVFYRKSPESKLSYYANEYFVIMQIFKEDSIWNDKDCTNVIKCKNIKQNGRLQKFILCTVLLDDKKQNGLFPLGFSSGGGSLQFCRLYLPLRDEQGNELPDAPNLPHDNPQRIAYEKKMNDLVCDYLLNSKDKELHSFDFTFKEKEPVFNHDVKWIKTRQMIEREIIENLKFKETLSVEYIFLLDFSIYACSLYGFGTTKDGKSYMLDFKTIHHDNSTLEMKSLYVCLQHLYPIESITGVKLHKYLEHGLIYKVKKDPDGKVSLFRVK